MLLTSTDWVEENEWSVFLPPTGIDEALSLDEQNSFDSTRYILHDPLVVVITFCHWVRGLSDSSCHTCPNNDLSIHSSSLRRECFLGPYSQRSDVSSASAWITPSLEHSLASRPSLYPSPYPAHLARGHAPSQGPSWLSRHPHYLAPPMMFLSSKWPPLPNSSGTWGSYLSQPVLN